MRKRLLFLAVLSALGALPAPAQTQQGVGRNAPELSFDFSDFRIGTIENEQGPTGATVIWFNDRSVYGAVDIGGGAASVNDASALEPLNADGTIEAVYFAGGSVYGQQVQAGVLKSIHEIRGFDPSFGRIPAVPGAIVYDFGARDDSSVVPNAEMGYQAMQNLETGRVRIGRAGAGRNVIVGKMLPEASPEWSGQGAAFYHDRATGVKIFTLSVVNALGNVVHPDTGEIIKGSRLASGERVDICQRILRSGEMDLPKGNTTVSLVITNVPLDRAALARLARTVHTNMASVIKPFQTSSDGDALFAISTATLPASMDGGYLGLQASRVMHQAVLNAVRPFEFRLY